MAAKPDPVEPPKGNGCGPSWLPGWAWPDAGFTEACNEHDHLYAVGGDEKKRFSADSTFMVRMNEAAGRQKVLWKRIGLGLMVPINHTLVRVGGWISFKKRPAP